APRNGCCAASPMRARPRCASAKSRPCENESPESPWKGRCRAEIRATPGRLPGRRPQMFRTVATLALVALLALVTIRIVAGVAGGIIGLLIGVAFLFLKLLIVAAVVYFVLTIVAPDTAKKLRDRLSGRP